MSYLDLVAPQLVDPFRIGLVIALLLTAERTRAATGMALPLALGVLFIAVIIPTTLQASTPDLAVPRMVAGIVSTGLLLAVALAGLAAYRRLRG